MNFILQEIKQKYVKSLSSWKERNEIGKTPINCTRSTFTLDNEDMSSADIVDEFAEDHNVWAQAFIEGWQVRQAIGSIPAGQTHTPYI